MNPVFSSPSRRSCWLRVAISLVALCCFSLSMWAETVVIRADSWMPMNGDPGAAKPGYVVEILKAICKDSGLTLDYQLMPWEESLEAVKAGKIDGVIGASAKEAAGLVVPTECIGTARVSLWLAKDKLWRYRDVDSLAKVKIGVNSGYSYWDAFDEYIRDHPGPQIVEFSGDNPLADMIKKLKAGELDVVPETEAVFLWNVRELGFSTDDFRAEYTHTGDPVFVAFAAGAKGERLAKLLDAGMAKLRKSGELARILERYGVTRLL